jgi:hypothetical protein
MTRHRIDGGHAGLLYGRGELTRLWIDGDADDYGNVANVRVVLREGGASFNGADIPKATKALEEHVRKGCPGCYAPSAA